ncbi:hypothetical protein ACA910_001834 [Epithemia clementina (nom. ined.)]
MKSGYCWMMDDCAGPNCVINNQPHACQSLFEFENTFHDGNWVLKFVWFSYLGLMVLLGVLFRTKWGVAGVSNILGLLTTAVANAKETKTIPCGGRRHGTEKNVITGVRLAKLTVKLKSNGRKLVNNVSLDFKPGTVNGLMGRSGSGKTTLLGAISGQTDSGVTLDANSDIKIDIDGTTYLRQHDLVAIENLTPATYLSTSPMLSESNIDDEYL